MPGSIRHQWAERMADPQPDPLIEYEVLDPTHQPDLNGELAGGKVYTQSGKQFVRLTASQARFYLDSGSIAPIAQDDQQDDQSEPESPAA